MIPFFMRIRTLIFILIFPLGAWSQQIRFTPDLKLAFGKMAELRFQEAEDLIAREEQRNPDNLALAYMRGALLTVGLFISESESEFEDNQSQLESYISTLEKAPDSDPQKGFMISQLRLGMAILHGRFRNNFSAGWQFYKAYNLLENNYKVFPQYKPGYVPLGVLYVAIGSLPDGYQSIASIIGIKGDVKKGMELIRKGYYGIQKEEENRFYRDYFGFIYSYISLELSDDNSVSPESLGLNVRTSSYLRYMQARVEVDRGNARKALDILKTRPRGDGYQHFGYLDYYTGRMALAFSPDTAYQYLHKYLKENSTGNYRKSTYRYLSWYAMLIDDKSLIREYRQKVMREGTLNTGADKQAYREAQEPFNEILIKGRIYFDGGLYSKAAKYLLSRESMLDQFGNADKLEFYYRLGRVFQESEESDKAIVYFKKALEIPVKESTFSQGNAALQLASVWEKKGNKAEARKYYEKTLSYKGFPFYEGLHQKAKAGLNRI
ncbi:MAG TPA: hypothetical protein DCG19_02755 [Cryomorphaceae bacterium]|nr:hypothetical protein [Owenweeksia sp.]MBF99755.1 hypothetical protein [Owenweeksia sp.]HAD96295.1 hypothetical protein [Cryomorphaceae bacterium]HBF21160.1 hypothetical protein [Cryomorphaceae bacterium]HCQ16124.1 hypothetical protein [Cryomorphaceae bacterium]|tara:strand:- start:813 stop:2291 length:1479 start_codon:yes stop_codon:yes gene_type:complete